MANESLNQTDLSNATWYEPSLTRDQICIILPLSAIYVGIFLLGVLGNVSTCVVIGRNRQMRTATNYYLFSLACSDLLLLITGLPLELHKIWFPYPYPFDEATCIIQGLAAETSANATVLTILLFTCERYIAIVHPLAKHRLGNTCLARVARAPCLLSCVWFLALALAVPQSMQFGIINPNQDLAGAPDLSECTIKRVVMAHAFLVSTVLFFLGPLSIITCLYIRIAVKLEAVKRHRIRCTAGGTSQSHVVRILVAVVFTFFVCWAPFHAQRLVAVYVDPGGTPEETASHKSMFNAITYISGVLYFFSTMLNPILYHSMSNKFKEAFWDTIYRDFHGFSCITIPEHWIKKQESRNNFRRGQDVTRLRNGKRVSGDMFELLPMKTMTSTLLSSDSTKTGMYRPCPEVRIIAYPEARLVNRRMYNYDGTRSVPDGMTLKRSQSVYANGLVAPLPPRRSHTVDVINELMRLQCKTWSTTPKEEVVKLPTVEVAAKVKKKRVTIKPDPSILDAIMPCPLTPNAPLSPNSRIGGLYDDMPFEPGWV